MSHKLMRIDPFADIAAFDAWPIMDEFVRPFRLAQMRDLSAPQIRVDVSEDEKAYKVVADIPGVSKDDIKVIIEGGNVNIIAESASEKEEKGKSMVHSERHYGRCERSFRLAHDIDSEHSGASYMDGVLKLNLPKKMASKGTMQLKIN